ncbi:terminase small subunit [Turicibacter sanguinis]|uniref:terminase small subunit n=1 Tax=Turicibacter sanguinis TaxID=154288 RepID=UPI0029433B18|nr:terminase small subunit [Turicibacter sanguinis]
MREEWLLMEKIAELMFKGEEIPRDKRADFYLIQECLKILELVEECGGFRLNDRQTIFCLLYPYMNFNALKSYIVAYQTTYKNANRNAYKVLQSLKVKVVMQEITKFVFHCRVNGWEKTKEIYDLG